MVKKFGCESNLWVFNEISLNCFPARVEFLPREIDTNYLPIFSSHIPAIIASSEKQKNLVSEKLQKVLNCYLISCCFKLYAARQPGKEKSWKTFSKYMPEAEERKQWVKRVMMGNRSEIKLKTKHHGEVFPSSTRHSLCSFLWNFFSCNNKISLFCLCNIKNSTECERVVEPNAMILSIEEMEKVI